MTSKDIRKQFLDFFVSKGHVVVPSAPVIPGEDPTLLFTNAGMNQFKDVFLGTGQRPYRRAVDTQKVIRVSGKHNDLEEVGRDTYHHTFFEMLGNWSFGDYYKKEAIGWAWELLTNVWKLEKRRLWATVYRDDDEAATLWREVTDIDPSHILRFGEKENFWEMGETGPCGPCSEIHYDHTPDGTATADQVNAGIPEVIEIWNLVFIQYHRDENGTLNPLPAKHVDTGMGFERMCTVLQHKSSNYDTDVFLPLIHAIARLCNRTYNGSMGSALSKETAEADVAMRVIADHVRTLSFAIADGVVPSNEGRGYVLRRILRRAARFGRTLGFHEPFIHTLVATVAGEMGDVFPEVRSKQQQVEKIIRGEEEGFNATLDRGLDEFDEIVRRASRTSGGTTITGDDAFRLYDTFGFPLDLTALIAGERGLLVDEEGFGKALERAKARSRDAQKEGVAPSLLIFKQGGVHRPPSTFVGYDRLETDALVTSQADGFLTLDTTPFYAESGGQVGDTGVLTDGMASFRILDTQKEGSVIAHRYEGPAVDLLSRRLHAAVDKDRRRAIARNHTATHLVHEALRRVLGEHLHQQGSLVTEQHLRFDFNHFERVTPEQLAEIESIVNQKVTSDIAVIALNDPNDWVPIEVARTRWPNVKMFFGEKYGDKVRVVEIDPAFSVELCGGTHVTSTGDIGYFAFRSEGSVASGIRRIDAVTGDGAVALARYRGQDALERIASANRTLEALDTELRESGRGATDGVRDLRDRASELAQRAEGLRLSKPGTGTGADVLRPVFRTLAELSGAADQLVLDVAALRRSVDREAGKRRLKDAAAILAGLVEKAERIGGVSVVASRIDVGSADELKTAGDALRARLGSGVGVLASVIDEKVQIVCVVTDDLIASRNLKAGAIVGQVAKVVGGGGGGKPHLATAGGKDVSKVTEALSKTADIVRSML